jgi:hypothetical protein
MTPPISHSFLPRVACTAAAPTDGRSQSARLLLFAHGGRTARPRSFPAPQHRVEPQQFRTDARRPEIGGVGSTASERPNRECLADANEGWPSFVAHGARQHRQSVGGFVVSHDAWKDSVGEFADVQKVFAVGAKNV